ncbi:MAG: hypothetical protein IPP80_04385 [Ignavibacteria bacterium]|nr:hypothetical protein [Ignavibacteria bacterium]
MSRIGLLNALSDIPTFSWRTLMRIERETFGLHLIIVPSPAARIPISAAAELTTVAEHAAMMFRFGFKAFHLQEDHAHLLVTATAQEDVPSFLNTLLDTLREHIVALGGPFRGFSWDEAVHVTLLPPWHVEILASFVRDQERYHQTRTLEQELDEVFRPNALEPPEEIREPRPKFTLGAVN